MSRAPLPSLALLALALTGCSAIVQPPGNELRCEIGRDGMDPCPGAMTCNAEGRCVSDTGDCSSAPDGGTGAEEICNGEDDDCDGTIDEGHDRDLDGFTWCGSGNPDLLDCDDSDPNVHPAGPDGDPAAAREICDNKDNDCDRMVDEDPDDGPICEGAQQCVPREGCVEPDCTITGCPEGQRCDISGADPVCTSEGTRCTGPDDCPAGQICDTGTGSCVEQKDLGERCVVDTECRSGVCMAGEALGLGGGKVCGQACCTSADCPNGTLCWVPGTGARACLPPETVGLTAKGTGGANAECSSGAECASGLCDSELGCVTHCTSDGQCSDGICGLRTYDRPDRSDVGDFACGASVGSRTFGDGCSGRSDCRSGVCVEVVTSWGEVIDTYCSRPCSTHADCPDVRLALQENCSMLQLSTGEYVPMCLLEGSAPDANRCCTDAHCGAGRCREVRRSEQEYEMLCQ